MNKKNIIVTGGTGFIGSHLVEELVKKKLNVVVLDLKIHSNSYFEKTKLKNRVTLEFVDIRDRAKLEKIFLKYDPRAIFHLAAEPIVDNAFSNPVSTFETNIMGTVNVLEISRKLKNLEIVIVASSDKAYGKTKEKYSENHPLRGDHPYDVSKSCADLIANTYFKTYNLPVAITRFGNVYGEGDIHMDRIVPGICQSVVNKEKLLIRSDGTFVRDYLYVKDVVEGYLFLLSNYGKIKGEAFNFSSKDKLSVLGMIKKASKTLKVDIKYEIQNIAKNEIPYQHLDDSKVRKLGWSNKFLFKEAIGNTYNWYKNNLKNV